MDSMDFHKLYEKGLAYEAEMMVNYCPVLGTVLANEEVENGVSQRRRPSQSNARPLRQWVLKITAYAERLLQDLDLMDWPESLKKLQINWIGKSEGAHVQFPVKNNRAILLKSIPHDLIPSLGPRIWFWLRNILW